MKMNPIATIIMDSGCHIVVELLPEAAPNTVNSFIFAAVNKIYDGHSIERIVPGSWIDASYTAFGHEAAKYLIPYEHDLNPDLEILPSVPGVICMGGYDDAGQSGCEFFFPLRECPEHAGVYPVFGRVTEGMDEIWRMAAEPLVPVLDIPLAKQIEINRPITPQVIVEVRLSLNGYRPAPPVKMKEQNLPACWLRS